MVLFFLAGCAATAPDVTTTEPDAPPEEDVATEVPAAGLLMESDLVTAGIDGRVTHGLESPSGEGLALHVTSDDTASIVVADRSTSRIRTVHEAGMPTELSMAWSPDGEHLYVGQRGGSGSGIREIDASTGTVRNVGCSASDVILGVRDDGVLAVRGENNVYMVAREDCATRETFDARRMIEIAVSPGGSHLAYVHRELNYNRESGAYEPDTTLHVVPTTGGEPTRIIGDRFAPRRISWLGNGSELAYDVVLQDDSGRRGLSIWSSARGQSSWVIPPDALTGSATHGRYGPDPGTFVFKLDGAWHFRTGIGSFVQPLPLAFEPEHLVWVGSGSLWIRRGAKSAFVELVEGAVPEETPGAVWAWTARTP
ncbi:MAG: hypothetical protein COV99_11860 [Bacteroidetes bacterium CG12_big_fil_rev_8_21_14_0_65_60_17]|nr:MAG: hypothetical protein COV99_11860 [Bacteroidetes bacterium CG12_big_fil_rev_8_21_14_0_65_60_17]